MSNFLGRTYLLNVTTPHGEELTWAPPVNVRFFVNNYPQHTAATARISIYGLSSRSREMLQLRDEQKQEYGQVTLSAGYEDDAGVIFTGKISSVQVAKEDVSTVVTLYCNSASARWDAASFQVWGDNTPYAEVIRDVAAGFGAPVEMVGDFSDLPVLPFGCNGGGRLCRDLLDQMKRHFGFYWIHTPVRTVIVRDGASREWSEYEINAANGMEGVPRWYAGALEVDIKLNHHIQPGDTVKVASDFWTLNFSGMYYTDLNNMAEKQKTTGKFSVLHTLHEGGLWGNDWKTTVICQWRAQS